VAGPGQASERRHGFPQPSLTQYSGSSPEAARFDSTVAAIERLPYQSAYVPTGFDSAFPGDSVMNDAPAEDYTTGSVPGSPDSPAFPPPFGQVVLRSMDGAPFYAEVAVHPGQRPGVVVVPGFNTNSKRSVVRWAAMLSANGYDVIAADQRDFAQEYQSGDGYPAYPQTFGWKEAEDVVAAGRYLAGQPGVTSLGIAGFSEGGQNTILAMAEAPGLFAAGLTFSAPADQDTQIYSTAAPPQCQTPACTYPATDALVAAVVPPYTYDDPCAVLSDAAGYYHTTGFGILADESAFHAQRTIQVPLLNFYAADDSLVPAFEARMMAGYEEGAPLKQTLEIQHGEHAYFYDRWWQQNAILTYFKALLPGAPDDSAITTSPTVNRTSGGTPLGDQLVPLGQPTPAEADSYLAPYICDTAQGSPGTSSSSSLSHRA
jgi:dienelactone hydrolase